MTTAASALRRMAEREPGLTAAGGLGLAAAAVCAAGVAIGAQMWRPSRFARRDVPPRSARPSSAARQGATLR